MRRSPGILLAFAFAFAVAMVALGAARPGFASAQAPSAIATPVPTAPPNPDVEPQFNYDIVTEVVVPLIGDDGRTHYVTLSEDTAGIVRVRLSLFEFAPLSYNVVLFRRGDCTATASFGPEDVIRPNYPFALPRLGGLVLTFFNTASITLSPGPRSIHDADGTSLAVYRPGSGGNGLLAACAVLASAPRAPASGTGAAETPPPGTLAYGAPIAFAIAATIAAVRRARTG